MTIGSRGEDGSVIVSGQRVTVEASFLTFQYDLTVNIKGDGYVEYSIDGAEFVKYAGTVKVPVDATVTLRAYADDGYVLRSWSGYVSSTDSEITIDAVTGTVTLTVTFAKEMDSLWFLYAAMAAILIIALLFANRGDKKGDEKQ